MDNNRFAALLREKKIAHEFRELPGEHSWVYWDQQVREVLRMRQRNSAPVRAQEELVKDKRG